VELLRRLGDGELKLREHVLSEDLSRVTRPIAPGEESGESPHDRPPEEVEGLRVEGFDEKGRRVRINSLDRSGRSPRRPKCERSERQSTEADTAMAACTLRERQPRMAATKGVWYDRTASRRGERCILGMCPPGQAALQASESAETDLQDRLVSVRITLRGRR